MGLSLLSEDLVDGSEGVGRSPQTPRVQKACISKATDNFSRNYEMFLR